MIEFNSKPGIYKIPQEPKIPRWNVLLRLWLWLTREKAN